MVNSARTLEHLTQPASLNRAFALRSYTPRDDDAASATMLQGTRALPEKTHREIARAFERQRVDRSASRAAPHRGYTTSSLVWSWIASDAPPTISVKLPGSTTRL